MEELPKEKFNKSYTNENVKFMCIKKLWKFEVTLKHKFAERLIFYR